MMEIGWNTHSLFVIAFFISFPLAGFAQQPRASARPSEIQNGTISGLVVDSAGQALIGATVSASVVGTNARPRSATTNSNGDFRIEKLDAGLYRMSAAMPGYVPLFQQSLNDSPAYYRIGDSVTLTLFKGGVITGTVVGPNGPFISGGVFATRVRDQDGKKLTSSFGLERSTDDRGVFRFYGLQPGAYLLYAARPRIGLIAPTAYDTYAPTYFPSATRDTASEILVGEGDEITADIQFRAGPGYAVSGSVAGVIISETRFAQGANLTLTNMRNRAEVTTTGTLTNESSSFVFYGIADGEYELTASQFLPTREELKSPPRRLIVHGGDAAGIDLTLSPQASIDGRIVFESAATVACGTRKETAARETIVYARRYQPEQTTVGTRADVDDMPVSAVNYVTFAVGDAKGLFTFRNLPPGSYRIDPHAPASGWYVRSVTVTPPHSTAKTVATVNPGRDGISVRSGERVSGLAVTIAEGAAKLRGRITLAEGQSLSANLRVYMIPAERENADNVLRFYETRPDADRSFTIDNISPGKYLIVALLMEEDDFGAAKTIRQDGTFRAKVVRDAEALKKDLAFKPCEQFADYQLQFSPPTSSP